MESSLCPAEAATPTRRRHSRDFKRQVVQESFAAGASIARVAQLHGINANLLHTWRWQFRRELGADGQALVPIQLASPSAAPAGSSTQGTGHVEVLLDCARVVVHGYVDECTLRSVFNALRT